MADGTDFYGLDARDRTYTQLDEVGVLDPAKVVQGAMENAVGVAGPLLLAQATMIEIDDDQPASAVPDMPMM